MRKDDPPGDVDVVVLPSDPTVLERLDAKEFETLATLLTLQDVIVGSPWPMGLGRLQPMASALDSFIARPEDEIYWHDLWSSVKRNGAHVPGERKGYAEVRI